MYDGALDTLVLRLEPDTLMENGGSMHKPVDLHRSGAVRFHASLNCIHCGLQCEAGAEELV